ncbi:lipid droplet-regulating VLDL assembly factor AUP1 isoform X2 [Neoarius graeffei]|uniref:lipid droplet-regulating VLDL assembly factor AUP1 isoform X2 n=1 Tax=Neoarius graeffei TaxID=443677 RepID=UPI00298C749D|nr:lipid droplet-regulating VLDL assembly factor AUP1 isoform X2 [Neoarius graeffei]
METRGIDQMFDFQRLPSDGLILMLLLLYTPVGLCLMLLRIFIGVHIFLVSCALPDSFVRRFIVRVMCSVLGLHAKQNNLHLRDKNVKLYVSNHVTQFDHNIINLLTSCHTPLLEGPSGFVCWARGFMELGTVTGSRAELAQTLRGYCAVPGALPLLLFPEEDTTNGRAALLKFSSWPFSVADTVQPVALWVKRPFIAVNVPESSWLTELLWTFFVPFTVYQVRWLPPVQRHDESHQEFAKRVQELMATEMGVVATRITKADKAEHIKRKRHTVSHTTHLDVAARPRTGAQDPRVVLMAQQVKEVLPDVPLSVITRDLLQTNCVDTTITNLLESTEQHHTEPAEAAPSGPSQPLTSTTPAVPAPPPALKPAAKTFGKSPSDRHVSLQDRKAALYDYARRRYIEKHGLDREEDS